MYKTFIYHTPILANILDPFDSIAGGKDSKDVLTWTPDLAFQRAKDHIATIADVYLPHPNDQLILQTSVADPDLDPYGSVSFWSAGSGSASMKWIRIWVAKNQPKSGKISTKINENHKDIIHFFQNF